MTQLIRSTFAQNFLRAVLLALALGTFTFPVHAANYVVTNTNDSISDPWGDTADTASLRYAMIQA
ncbi:MAG: hypothetical protein ABI304_07350, partial [Rudaea sp.]